jgi:hypothetical protein
MMCDEDEDYDGDEMSNDPDDLYSPDVDPDNPDPDDMYL